MNKAPLHYTVLIRSGGTERKLSRIVADGYIVGQDHTRFFINDKQERFEVYLEPGTIVVFSAERQKIIEANPKE